MRIGALPGAGDHELVGRDTELSRLAALLDTTGTGPFVVLIDGPAGAGKTAVLQAAVRMGVARDHLILACSAAEVEARLSFVALRDLLDPVFDEVAGLLPPPQHRALAVALLRQDPGDQAAEPGAVAAAVLAVLRELALQRPVLIVVDDLPWLDRPTASVLGFAFRRLTGTAVRAICTRRSDTARDTTIGADLHGIDLLQLPLRPLSLGAVQALLRDRHGLVLPRPTMRRLYEASGGNPFLRAGHRPADRGGSPCGPSRRVVGHPSGCARIGRRTHRWTLTSNPNDLAHGRRARSADHERSRRGAGRASARR